MHSIPVAPYFLAKHATTKPNDDLGASRFGFRLVPFNGAAFPRTVELEGAETQKFQVLDEGWINVPFQKFRFAWDEVPLINPEITEFWGVYFATSEDDLKLSVPGS